MTERELTLFSAMTNIGDDLVLESTAFLPAVGGAVGSAVGGTAAGAASAGKRAAWVLPVTLASCAAVVAAVGILVGVVGNAFGFFPQKPPEVTTEEGTTEDATVDLPAEGETYTVSFVLDGYPFAPPTEQTVRTGECAFEPFVDPVEDGGRFDGWYTAEDRGADSRFDFSTPITADLILYGAWIPMETFTEEPTEEPTEPSTEAEPESEETTEKTTEVSTLSEDDTEDAQPMPETVRDALTTHTDILHSTMVSWQRNLENVTVERVMDAIDRIEAASEFFGATNEGGYYLEVRDGNVYLCRKIVYPIHDGAEEGSQILSELLGEKS